MAHGGRPSALAVSDRLGGYRRYLFSRDLSHRSVAVYVRLVLRAEAWCEPKGYDLDTAPPELLQEWVDAEVPRSTSSRRQARSALGHYWRMSGRADAPVWVVRVPRQPVYACRALEPEDASKLAKAARARGDGRGLAVLLGLYVALRVSEIANIRWSDVDDGWLKVLGKGDRPAALPLHPVVVAAMGELVRLDDTWVFPGRFGGPAHPGTIWGWIHVVAEEAGIGRVTSHRLRHTCLATANDATGDLRGTQDLARHVKPETTAIYTRVTAKRLTDVVNAIDYG